MNKNMKKKVILIYVIVGSLIAGPVMGAGLYKLCISQGDHIELESVFQSPCSSSFEEKELCVDIPINFHSFVPSTSAHRFNQSVFAKFFNNLESQFSLDVNIFNRFSSCKFTPPPEHTTFKSMTVLLI